MTDTVLTLRLKADGSGLVGVIREASGESKRFGLDVQRASADAEQGLNRTARAADQVGTQLKQLRTLALSAFGITSVAAFVRQIATTADAYTNMTSRLKLATSSQQEFATAQREVFNIAQRTSSSLEATTSLYTRLQKSVKDLGGSQRDALALTETINQAFVISGASANESAGAIRQFAQALASGVLRGDEFNSVMEQAPRLSEALQQALGKSAGELRKMAEEGQITADVITKALLGQAPKIAAEFGQMPLTIGRAWTQLAKVVTTAIGKFDEARGVSRGLAASLQFVAENFDTLMNVAAALATVLTVNLAGRAIVAAVAGFRALATSAALSATAMTAFEGVAAVGAVRAGVLASSLAVLRGAFFAVGGWVTLLATGLVALGVYLYDTTEATKTYAEVVQEANVALEESKRLADELTLEGPKNVNVDAAQKQLDGYREKLINLDAQIVAVEDQLADLYEAAAKPFGPDVVDDIAHFEKRLAELKGEYNGIFGELVRAAGALREYAAAQKAAEDAANARAATKAAIDDLIKSGQKRLEQLKEEAIRLKGGEAALLAHRLATIGATEATAEQRDEVERLGAQINAAEAALARSRGSKQADARASRDAARAQRELNEAREEGLQHLRDGIAAEVARTVELDKFLESLRFEGEQILRNNEERAVANALRQAEAILLTNGGNLLDASSQKVLQETEALVRANFAAQRHVDEQERLADAAARSAEEYQYAWQGAVSSVSQSWGEFVANGFNGWRDFLDSAKNALKRWVAEVIAIMTQRALLQAFSGFGGGGGGFFGNLFSGFAGAMGGGASTNYAQMLGMMGQGGVPGFGGFAGMMGGGSGGAGGGLFSGSGLTAQIGGTYVAPWLGAAGGALYGFQNRGNNTAGSLAAAGAYGYLGYAAGTVALGAGLGAAGGAAVGAAGAGAATGAMGAAAAIPVVGWIIAALAIVDLISGGKLFGTKYKPKSFEQGLSIGPGGGSAFLNVNESRERALFGGTQRRTRSLDPGQEARAQAAELFQSIQGAADEVGAVLGVSGVVIAGTFTRVLDKKGKEVKEEFSTVFGRKYKENAEAYAKRMIAEAQIATVDAFLASLNTAAPPPAVDDPDNIGGPGGGGGPGGPGGPIVDGIKETSELIRSAAKTAGAVITGEAHQIAERWRASAETLLKGAQFLVLAASDMKKAEGLLGESGSLTQITNLIEDLQRGQETLSDTYARVKQSVSLFDQAIELMEVSIDKTREEIVRFSVEIADAAGGLERAQQLWQRFFASFYSAEEQATRSIDELRANRLKELADIGLAGDTTAEQFRELFEERLPTLSAEAVVEWLEAAEAIAASNEQLAQQRDILNQIHVENAAVGLSQFALQMGAVASAHRTAIQAANQLAQANGQEAASTRDLAAIHRWTAMQFRAAVAQLRAATQQLIATLYGTDLERLDAQIAELVEAQQDGIQSVSQASNDRYEAEVDAIARIKGFLDDLLIDANLSTLTPEQRLNEAQRQFNALSTAARGGDVDALQRLPQLAQELLQQARAFWSSGDQYTQIFDLVRSTLSSLGVTGTPGVVNGNPGSGGPGPTDPELARLQEERQEIIDRQMAAERLALADQLANQLRELAAALRVPVLELAENMGVNLEAFVADLGVNLDLVSTETAQRLAGIAGTLNVELTDLARSLGLELGELANAQSLLNDALEAEIAALPQAQRDALEPLLRNVETAAAGADQVSAITSLETAVDALGPEVAAQLAPYLSGINVTNSLLSDIDYLSEIADVAAAQLAELASIREVLGGEDPAAPTDSQASFDSGTAFVPHDMVASIHRGEMVIDARSAEALRRYGIHVAGGGDAATHDQTEKLERRLVSLEEAVKQMGREIATSYAQLGDKIVANVGRNR